MTPQIDILLATYNGADFLPEQLASLTEQTYPNWRLLLRDDGSTDCSPNIVREWAARTGAELVEVGDGETRVGPSESFSRLMARSEAPWFACCDQDDVWEPEKLEKLLAAGLAAEGRSAHDSTPILVHCDLALVDTDLRPLHPSFWKDRRNDHALRTAAPGHRTRLLMQGSVTGCAMLGNSALREAALPVPAEARMHDWWLSLVAAWRGQLVAVEATLVRYRQHGGNAMGSGRPLRLGAMLGHIVFDTDAALERTRMVFGGGAAQASAAFHELGDWMTRRERFFTRNYAQIDRGLRHLGGWLLLPWAIMKWRRWPLAAYILLSTFKSSNG